MRKYTKNITQLISNKAFILFIIFWGAINITPQDLIDDLRFSSLRLVIPLLISIYLIYYINKYKYHYNYSIILLIALQLANIIGIFCNISNIYNIYWPIIYIGYIILCIKFTDEFLNYNRLIISGLTVILSIYTFYILYKFNILNAYEINNLSGDVLGMPMSRSTGIARIAGLCLIYSIASIYSNEKVDINSYLLIIISTLMLIILNTRGAVIASLFAILFYTLFNIKFKKLILIIFLIVLSYFIHYLLVSIYLFYSINNNISESINHIEAIKRSVGVDVTSGRINIWIDIISKYKIIGIFGLGPMADKLLLNQNASGAMAYVFASSGIVGVAIYVAFMFSLIKRIYSIVYINAVKYYREISIVVFFITRSIFENSFTIYSIDAIIFIPALIFINKK